MISGSSPICDPPAVLQEERPDRRAAGRLLEAAGHEELALGEGVVDLQLDVDGADEPVPLGPGVVAGRLGQLPGQDLGERLELLGVGRG